MQDSAFTREWLHLQRALRRRSSARGLAFGALSGAVVTLGAMACHALIPAFQAWLEETLPLAQIWLGLPIVLGAVAGYMVGRFRPIDASIAAAWADAHGGGRDTVRTALITDSPFRPILEAEAATALERARTAGVPIRGFSGSVLGSFGVIVIAIAVALLAQLLPRKFTPPVPDLSSLVTPKLIENAAKLAENLAGAEQIAEWATNAGVERLQEAAEKAAKLAEAFASNNAMTQGEALSELSEIERSAAKAAGDEAARRAAGELMNSPEAMEAASKLLSQISPETVDSVMNSDGFKRLAEALSQMNQPGPNRPAPGREAAPPGEVATPGEPATGAPVESSDGQPVATPASLPNAEQVSRQLQELMRRSPIARDVIQEGLGAEHGRAALEAADGLQCMAREMRQQIAGAPAAPGAGDSETVGTPTEGSGGSGGRSSGDPTTPAAADTERQLLLIDLPAVPPRSARPSMRQGADAINAPHMSGGAPVDPATGAERTEPLVGATGRELEATGTDFTSRASRLPSALRDAAGRYFEPTQAGKR